MGLGSKYAEIYADSLDQIKKSSAQTMFEAKEFIFKTNAKQLELEFNRVSVALNNFGRGVNAISLSIINTFGGAKNAIATLTIAIAASATAWLLARANASGALTLMITKIKYMVTI